MVSKDDHTTTHSTPVYRYHTINRTIRTRGRAEVSEGTKDPPPLVVLVRSTMAAIALATNPSQRTSKSRKEKNTPGGKTQSKVSAHLGTRTFFAVRVHFSRYKDQIKRLIGRSSLNAVPQLQDEGVKKKDTQTSEKDESKNRNRIRYR